jgi:hypothetical protein
MVLTLSVLDLIRLLLLKAGSALEKKAAKCAWATILPEWLPARLPFGSLEC